MDFNYNGLPLIFDKLLFIFILCHRASQASVTIVAIFPIIIIVIVIKFFFGVSSSDLGVDTPRPCLSQHGNAAGPSAY